jgi:DNA polymerase III delta subunit
MSIKGAEHFFKAAASNKLSGLVLVRGDDPYLSREFFDLIKGQGLELHRFDVRANGPDANVESAALGMGLFAQKTMIWLKAKDSPSKWSKDSLHRWNSLRTNADGETLFIVVQVPEDRRMKWDALGIDEHISWASAELNQVPWLQRMIKKRQWDAGPERTDFLARLGFELIELDTAVELWSLGGDLWASKSLGWGAAPTGASHSLAATGNNVAFDWVDAVVEGRRKDAVALSRHLVDQEGAEPIQLLALLSKSLRLVALLSRGWNTKGYPDFLIRKWRSKSIDPRRVDSLIACVQQLDLRLKSSASDSLANLQHLSGL